MNKCQKCNKKIRDGSLFGCKNCNVTFCENCADKNFRICPNCYSDMELLG